MTDRQGTARALIVSATHSGAGKTTATIALIRGLRERGLRVQPFKLGPDFIDTAYLSEAAGRKAINLDLWMMGEAGVRRSFERWIGDADIAVVEAMGALHDGAGGSREGSAAQLAELLELPVVLVLEVAGMTRTAAAVLEGMIEFDPVVEVAGVILNRIGSARHAEMVAESLPPGRRSLILGSISRQAELEIPERHLGLLTAEENDATRSARDAALSRAGAGLDLDRVVGIARPVPRLENSASPDHPSHRAPQARLAIARDRAFCFYYEENLRLMSEAGFEPVPFSPTADRALPRDVDAVYLGGGYPESFAAELAANRSLAAELRERTAAGMPLYAECGGLLYLARSLTGFDGSRHEMSGVLPLDVVMDREYLAIDYVTVRTTAPSPLGPAGTTARGQEFHQSRIAEAEIDADLYEITTSDGQRRRGGFRQGNVIASYAHLHLGSAPAIAASFAAKASSSARARGPFSGDA
jgi:cobyrinic acid a,c-diamide synthase